MASIKIEIYVEENAMQQFTFLWLSISRFSLNLNAGLALLKINQMTNPSNTDLLFSNWRWT